MNEIYQAVYNAVTEIMTLERSDMRKIRLLVVGCSTSEIAGGTIGKASVPTLGNDVASAVIDAAKAKGAVAAFQCCEHLNRALIIERACAEKYGYDEVSVKPQPKAGGSFATATYAALDDAIAVEHIRAHAGLDIGGTLIGMHLRDVAVPVRISISKIGEANILCARTRPKYIGGERAVY